MKKAWIYSGVGILVLASFWGFTSISRNTKNAPLSANVSIVDTPTPPEPTVDSVPLFHYIEITGGCKWDFTDGCVNVRSGAGTSFPVVMRLRDGIVFKVEATTVSGEGHDWYKIVFEKNIRYPERILSDWYVVKDDALVRSFTDAGDVMLESAAAPSDKRIVVDISSETLTAYDGDTVFMEESVSTGIDTNLTPIGTFRIFKKTPSRYMQGPLPGETSEYYDLPGVPWDLYFTAGGAVLHGAYWHDDFGTPKSHGCVNQTPEDAKKLYSWADLGTKVVVQN